MEDDYGSNVHAGLEKSACFYGVSALEFLVWRAFVIRDSLGIRLGQNFFVRLRELSALEAVCFREVPLYLMKRNGT